MGKDVPRNTHPVTNRRDRVTFRVTPLPPARPSNQLPSDAGAVRIRPRSGCIQYRSGDATQVLNPDSQAEGRDEQRQLVLRYCGRRMESPLCIGNGRVGATSGGNATRGDDLTAREEPTRASRARRAVAPLSAGAVNYQKSSEYIYTSEAAQLILQSQNDCIEARNQDFGRYSRRDGVDVNL